MMILILVGILLILPHHTLIFSCDSYADSNFSSLLLFYTFHRKTPLISTNIETPHIHTLTHPPHTYKHFHEKQTEEEIFSLSFCRSGNSLPQEGCADDVCNTVNSLSMEGNFQMNFHENKFILNLNVKICVFPMVVRENRSGVFPDGNRYMFRSLFSI